MGTEETILNNAETPPAVPAAVTPETKPVVEAVAETKVEDAAAQTKAPETAADIKYDLKLAEGSPLTQANVDEIVSFAKERGLSNEQATELLAREEGVLKQHNQTQLTKFEALRTDWYNEINGDKELGGDNLKQTAEFAQRALEKFAPDTLKAFLKSSPYGNHPDLIRTFYKIGKAMANDTLVSANSHSTKTKSYEELLYDNTPKEN